MEIQAQHAYAMDIDKLFAAFGQRETILAKLQAMGARNIKIERCDATATSLDVQIHREVPTDAPGVLKKFLGDWSPVAYRESWHGTPGKEYRASFEVHLEGVPVQITGSMVLTPEGQGTVNRLTMSITCGIPFVGGKLAEFIGHNSEKTIADEYQFLKQHLQA